MSLETLSLRQNDIDVWLLRTEVLSAAARECCRGYVSSDEWERSRRFVTQYLQDQFLQSRALIRAALSCYASIPPQEWQFITNSYGRPFVAPHLRPPEGINFSLSHTQDFMALSVSRAEQVGIDLENTEREIDFLKIARTYFSPHECEQLGSLLPGCLGAGFWSLWTLKESFIKAKSMGMAIPLNVFSFDIGSSPPRFTCDESQLGHCQNGWNFRLLSPTEKHVLAICHGPSVSDVGGVRLRLIDTLRWDCNSVFQYVISGCSPFE